MPKPEQREAEIRAFNALETVPQVSFDVKLGKKYSYIDFDYVAYDDYLRSKGMSSEAIEDTAIKFKKAGIVNFRHGYYSRLSDKLALNIGNNKDRPNKILAHESEHRIDHANRISRIDTIANAAVAIAGVYCLLTGAVDVMEGISTHNQQIYNEGTHYWLAGSGFMSVWGILHPLTAEERRARKAEKDAPKILRLTERLPNH